MKRLYTVKEAARTAGMSEEDIVDLVRLGEITDCSNMFAFTLDDGTELRTRDRMRILADDIGFVIGRDSVRYELFSQLSDAPALCSGPENLDEETEIAINNILQVWQGALFDDPDDREVEIVVLLLLAMHRNLQFRKRRLEEWREQAKAKLEAIA